MSGDAIVVDDQPYMRRFLRDALEEEGYTVINEASTGEEAVDCAISEQPDVVVMDVWMPRSNGVEAATTIKEETDDVTVVMCSGVGHEEVLKEAVKAGADSYIKKPFEPDDLHAVINDAIA